MLLLQKTIQLTKVYKMKNNKLKRVFIPLFAAGFLFFAVSFKNDFFEIAKQIEVFTEVFKTVNQNYVDKTVPAELMDTALKSMLKDLDPYTYFFNEQDVIRFKINKRGEYTGIGAKIDQQDGFVIIKEVYENYPADKAGLKAGDVITKVGDVSLEDYQEDASALLKGSKNAKLVLEYKRQNKKQTATLTLDAVEIKAVPYYALLEGNVGYIVLSKFTEKAALETENALTDLKNQGATSLVLDLQNNPGGLLSQAIQICNLFVDKDQIIVTTKSKNEEYNKIYKTKRNPVDTEIPLVIIVNGRSASASEIVSGAMQDLDRGVVVGSRSFGKGLVQRPMQLPYGTQVKVTISRYFTPAGRCIQALDYAHKDENGKAIKFELKEATAFKTKGGRTVYDGGGVNPDIVLADTQQDELIKALDKTNIIFDFVNDWFYKNPNATADNINVSFDAFKAFAAEKDGLIQKDTEEAINSLKTSLEKSGLTQTAKNQIETLEKSIANEQLDLIEKNKSSVLQEIKEEILLRIVYRKGMYLHATKENPFIVEAKKIALDQNKYQKILK